MKIQQYVSQINSDDTKSFIQEAVECYERKLWRSAVIMSWVGAVYFLYDFIMKNKLAEFNEEASRRFPKHKRVTTMDQLARCLSESDFLNVIEGIGVISNSVNKELKGCLDRRNSCGHPNTYTLRQNTVSHHIFMIPKYLIHE